MEAAKAIAAASALFVLFGTAWTGTALPVPHAEGRLDVLLGPHAASPRGALLGAAAAGGIGAQPLPVAAEADLALAVEGLWASRGLAPTPEDHEALRAQVAALPPAFAAELAPVVASIAAAELATRGAFGHLTQSEIALLADCSAAGPCAAAPEALQALLAGIPRERLVGASVAILDALDAALPGLAATAAAHPGLAFADPLGAVLVLPATSGVHDLRDRALPPSVVVDLGGDDTLLGAVGAGVGAWPATGDVVNPSNFVGVAVDLGGDDTYQASWGSQGYGRLGVGILLEVSGSDTYTLESAGQGYGNAGVGLLADLGGADRYTCGPQCQAHGREGGLGVLYDGAGHDAYTGQDWVQGFGFLLGTGVLVDLAGDDRYTAGFVSQAASEQVGNGLLLDHDGRDTYGVLGASRGYVVGLLGTPLGVATFRDLGSDADAYAGGAPGANGAFWMQPWAGTGHDL